MRGGGWGGGKGVGALHYHVKSHHNTFTFLACHTKKPCKQCTKGQA